jgi:hypothetical protein
MNEAMLQMEKSNFHSKDTFNYTHHVCVKYKYPCCSTLNIMFSKIQNRNTVNRSTLSFINTKDKIKKTLLCSKIHETSLKAT